MSSRPMSDIDRARWVVMLLVLALPAILFYISWYNKQQNSPLELDPTIRVQDCSILYRK